MLPPWLASVVATLPVWIQWLVPVAMNAVLFYVFPALEKAFPGEAPLIADIVKWLTGQGMGPSLKAAHAHYHSLKAAEPKGE